MVAGVECQCSLRAFIGAVVSSVSLCCYAFPFPFGPQNIGCVSSDCPGQCCCVIMASGEQQQKELREYLELVEDGRDAKCVCLTRCSLRPLHV